MGVPNIYLVLGCPRSGTSLVAGLLHKNGVNMGGWFSGTAPQNPRGFFEDRNFADMNAAILYQLPGCAGTADPHIHRALQMPDWNVIDVAAIRQKLSERIAAGEESGREWGIKDPRIVLLWPAYRPHLPDTLPVRLVVTHRNPLNVVRSWIKYRRLDESDLEYGLQVVNEYERRLCEIIKEAPWPVLHVGFEDWWHPDPQRREGQRRALDGFVGRELDYEFFDAGLWRA